MEILLILDQPDLLMVPLIIGNATSIKDRGSLEITVSAHEMF